MLKLDSKQPRKLYIYINIILSKKHNLKTSFIWYWIVYLHKQVYLLYMTKKTELDRRTWFY